MNKKGNIAALLIIFIAILVLLVVAFAGSLLLGAVQEVADDFVPTIDTIGDDVGGTNFTELNSYTFKPLQTITNSMSWVLGLGLVVGLLLTFVLAFSFRFTGNKWLIAPFLLLALLSIVVTMFISNSYEDFHAGSDGLALKLQDMNLLSFILIYAPMIATFIIFIAGIIMFTGQEEFV